MNIWLLLLFEISLLGIDLRGEKKKKKQKKKQEENNTFVKKCNLKWFKNFKLPTRSSKICVSTFEHTLVLSTLIEVCGEFQTLQQN